MSKKLFSYKTPLPADSVDRYNARPNPKVLKRLQAQIWQRARDTWVAYGDYDGSRVKDARIVLSVDDAAVYIDLQTEVCTINEFNIWLEGLNERVFRTHCDRAIRRALELYSRGVWTEYMIASDKMFWQTSDRPHL